MTVEATGIHRAFGGVQALRDASFAARPGEIHALAGENGAGKSTLIKVLCGVLRADAGSVAVRGRVATAFQELSLLPDLTVAENLLLAAPPRGRLGLVRRSNLAAEASRILSLYGVTEIDPRSPARDLAVSQKQVVELVRVLAHGARRGLPRRADGGAGGTRGRLASPGTCGGCATPGRAWCSPRTAGGRSSAWPTG